MTYPVRFSVDYPDRPLNRLTTGFRFITVIPIVILMATLEHINVQAGQHWFEVTTAGGTIVLATVLMLLFRQKYPRWWFDWNLEFTRFTNRIGVYWALMDDRYPSTDDHQSVHLDYPEVSGPELNRWLPLVKWFLAIPHYIVLFFLGIAAFFVVDLRLVRDPLHRPIPARRVRVRRGRSALGEPRRRLRVRARHGQVPAVQPVAVDVARWRAAS